MHRVSRTASERWLPMTVSTVVVAFPMPLMTDVAIEVGLPTLNLEGIIFVRALVSVAGIGVMGSLVSASEKVSARIKFPADVRVLRV